jgi:hypothetical protein
MNRHGIISITTLWHIPQYTTHKLSFPEKWWMNGHGIISITMVVWQIPYSTMHNSPPIISRSEWRMNGHGALPLCGTFHNAQLTACYLQSRMENEWTQNHQHHHSLVYSTMHLNSQTIIFNAKWRMNRYGIISITLWHIPQCRTYKQLFP